MIAVTSDTSMLLGGSMTAMAATTNPDISHVKWITTWAKTLHQFHWREDQKACWACAAQKETQESARWAMDEISSQCRSRRSTATLHCAMIRGAAPLPGDRRRSGRAGNYPGHENRHASGLYQVPTRPMGVKTSDLKEITQSTSMYEEPGDPPTASADPPGSRNNPLHRL